MGERLCVLTLQTNPMQVEEFSTALAAYSTWKTRPSVENVVDERSYPVPIDVISEKCETELGE